MFKSRAHTVVEIYEIRLPQLWKGIKIASVWYKAMTIQLIKSASSGRRSTVSL